MHEASLCLWLRYADITISEYHPLLMHEGKMFLYYTEDRISDWNEEALLQGLHSIYDLGTWIILEDDMRKDSEVILMGWVDFHSAGQKLPIVFWVMDISFGHWTWGK